MDQAPLCQVLEKHREGNLRITDKAYKKDNTMIHVNSTQ